MTNQWLLLKRLWRLGWLTGPIVEKELRVASRQWKFYLLRFGYVCLLVFVIFQFWHAIVRVGGGAAAVGQVSRAGEAGRRIIVTIVWFQFIAAQILAAVLLSDAISGEVRRRTLEGLLVARIGGFQIVVGKLLSRLLQIVLLLAAGIKCRTTTAAVSWVFGVFLCLVLLASLLPGGVGILGIPARGREGESFGTALNLLSVGFVYGGLGLLGLRESARELRRDVFR